MDIRKFFPGSKATPGSSALSGFRKQQTPLKEKSKEKETKEDIPRRSNSRATKADPVYIDDSSDDENPIPPVLRSGKKTKRSRVIVSSDSEEERPKKKKTLSPQKPSPRKKSTHEGDEATLKKKPTAPKASVVSDDSDEFLEEEEKIVKRAKGRRKTPPGQSKLKLQASSHKEEPKKAPPSNLQHINAAEFFDDTPKVSAKKPAEAEKKMSKKTKTSPSSKENVTDGAESTQAEKGSKRKKKSPSPAPTPPPKKSKAVKPAEIQQEMRSKKVTPKKILAVEKEEVSTKSIRKETSKSKEPTTKSDAGVANAKATPEKSKAVADTSPKKTEKAAPSPASVATLKTLSLPFVDKYRPKSLSQLVGQNGEKSPMNKLLGWLKDWPKHNMGAAVKVKKPRPPPWMHADGSFYKAILLSGPPGVGKTTCAEMACAQLGLECVEMNASDVRNKKNLEAHVMQLIGSHQIDEFFSTHRAGDGVGEMKHVLIMDEVDGMSGNEDRAGLAELIQMIKSSRIPIICICNDRSSPKMRTLVNYCFDVRFPRPRIEQIRPRILSIVHQEGLRLSKEEVDELIESSGHDIRQTLYNLQLRAALGQSVKIVEKDTAVNTFEAARKLLDRKTSIVEKLELFFMDYSIMPLFVQENYPNLHPADDASSKECLKRLSKAADAISMGDLVDKTIRTTGAWKLLNEEALFSCALPSFHMNGYLKAMINFPSWLGRNSTSTKRMRLARQLAAHTHLKISADCHSLVTDYVPRLREKLTRPLIERDAEGVPEIVSVYEEYALLKDDTDAIAELAVWDAKKDPAANIAPKVKAALTRALNKTHRLLPYVVEEVAKGRKKASVDTELEIDEEGNLVERSNEDDNEDEADNEGEEPKNDKAGETRKPVAQASTRGRGASRGRGRARGK